MTKPNLLFLKKQMVDDEIIKIVKTELIHVPISRNIGTTITRLINSTLNKIKVSNDFGEVCKLSLTYTALKKLRSANVRMYQYPGLGGVNRGVLGRQVILEHQYVIYEYTEGVWTYRDKSKTTPIEKVTFSRHHPNNHARLSKMLVIAYPVKFIDSPYVIHENHADEGMNDVLMSEMNDYVGFLNEEKMIMAKLVELYKVMRGYQ